MSAFPVRTWFSRDLNSRQGCAARVWTGYGAGVLSSTPLNSSERVPPLVAIVTRRYSPSRPSSAASSSVGGVRHRPLVHAVAQHVEERDRARDVDVDLPVDRVLHLEQQLARRHDFDHADEAAVVEVDVVEVQWITVVAARSGGLI